MASLRIIDGNAVHKQRDLVESASINADVRLNTKTAALTDIYTRGQFQYVVHTRDPRSRNVRAAQRGHLTGCYLSSQRSSRGRYLGAV